MYPAGIYVVTATSRLNNMQTNYLNGGAAYTGRTVTEVKQITLVSDTVKITVNKDSVVRTNDFSVTITGRPGGWYNVWVKNTHAMELGAANNAPPIVTKGQDRIFPGDCQITRGFPWSTDTYAYQNGGGKIIEDNAFGTDDPCDVFPDTPTGEYSFASVRLSTAGTWTVGFTTTAETKAQKYTVRVEQNLGDNCDVEGCDPDDFKGDQVDVKVEKGAVTIVAGGSGNYFLGDEIKLSGTNSESDITYLFLVGPNLEEDGAALDDPAQDALVGECGDQANWRSVYADVLADNTWSYKWGTATIDLDAGTYTIYAVSQAADKDRDGCLPDAAFSTVSIILKKPFINAEPSQTTVAKGDRLYINGKAEGQPGSVAIWILGKNYANRVFEPVEAADSSFKYEIQQALTANLYSGQYYVVVQHPMQNGQFDIATDLDDPVDPPHVFVYNLAFDEAFIGIAPEFEDSYSVFKLVGAGALQGSDAAEALGQALNSPNVDDWYTKFKFTVEEPVILIDPIPNKYVADTFTITAATNLAVDDEILVEVYSSSFKPTQKTMQGEFSGATGVVKVTDNPASNYNKIEFPVNAASFIFDEYIVTMNAVIQEATGSALFLVVEGAAPTAKPTVAPNATPTATQTATPTATPTPTPTPTKSPGYGALIALIGLGAVAFIVVRRH
jgi:PGF-CTERM protein